MRGRLLIVYVVPLLPLLLLVRSHETPPAPPELERAGELSSRGDHEGAIRVLLGALETPSARQSRGASATIHYELASAHNSLGDYVAALRFAQEAEVRFRRDGLLHESAIAAAGVGALHSTLGRHDEGAEALRRALGVFRLVGDERRVASALLNLGTDDAQRGRPAAALEKLREAERLAAKIGNDGYRALALNNIAGTHLKTGEYAASRESMLQALALFRAQEDVLNEAAGLGILSRAELGLGNVAAALAHGRSALALVESERDRLLTPELQATLAGSFQPAYDAVLQAQLGPDLAAADEGRLESAFRTSERARARLLFDRLAHLQTAAGRGADPADLAEEERLRAELQPRARTLAADDALLARYRQVQARIRALTPPPEIGFDDVRRALLQPRGTLLEYWLGEDRSVVWLIGPATARAYPLGTRESIERLAREYASAIRDRQADPARLDALGTQLADAVLPREVIDALEPGRIVLVTHGALDLVPFAALPVVSPASGTRRPLVADFETAYLSSSAAATALSGPGRRDRPSRGVGVFADPRITALGEHQEVPPLLRATGAGRQDVFGPLPYTGEEARAIASAVTGEAVDLWLQADATRERVLSSAGTYRILHFATHALVSPEQPETSGLVLSADVTGGSVGYLTLADVYGLRLRADLVVLSACDTALGRQIRGEGLVGLTHGFLSAGARRVIATLWQVNDAATSTLMAELYTQMFKHGQSPAAALRSAQLTQFAAGATRPPYFWAAFRVYGG